MNYSDIYKELQYNVGAFIFIKKDGTIRVMLGTRSLDIAKIQYGWISGELNKMDARCSISNGNIGLIDLCIGEGRCFNIKRLAWYKNLGPIETKEQFEKMISWYLNFSKMYQEKFPDIITLGMNTIEEIREKVEIPLRDLSVFNGELTI